MVRLCKLKLEPSLGAAPIEAPQFAAEQLIGVEQLFAAVRLSAAEQS